MLFFYNVIISVLLLSNGIIISSEVTTERQITIGDIIKSLVYIDKQLHKQQNSNIKETMQFWQDCLRQEYSDQDKYRKLFLEGEEKYKEIGLYDSIDSCINYVSRHYPELDRESPEFYLKWSNLQRDKEAQTNFTKTMLNDLMNLIQCNSKCELEYKINSFCSESILHNLQYSRQHLQREKHENAPYFIIMVEEFFKKDATIVDPTDPSLYRLTEGLCPDSYKEFIAQWLPSSAYNAAIVGFADHMNDWQTWNVAAQAKCFLDLPENKKSLADAKQIIEQMHKLQDPYVAIWYSKNEKTNKYGLKKVNDWYSSSKNYWLSTVK